MDLAVTGLGMLTSIGSTVESSCAAHRAGISRASELPGHSAPGDSEAGGSLLAHRLRGFGEGLVQFGLWSKVGEACLRDLRRYGEFPGRDDVTFWSRTWIIAAIPVLDEERFLLPTDDVDGMMRKHFLEPAASAAGIPVPRERLLVVEEGHCGAAWAIQQASRLLEHAQADRVIVLSVDSYCDDYTLAWLAEQGSLKSDETPMGLMPGEAGSCFALEDAEAARARGARVDALITGAATDNHEEYEYLQPERIGTALGGAVQEAIRSSGVPFAGHVYTDLNGLEWRAKTWGHAQISLVGVVDFERSTDCFPATSFGETGATSAPIAVSLATRAFRREGAPRALVCSVNEFGEVAAIHLRPA
jgi:3-oxoacyl-[acyl-carrier-protein] synthase-1